MGPDQNLIKNLMFLKLEIRFLNMR